MSTTIGHEFDCIFPKNQRSFAGVLLFYVIVLIVILGGAYFSYHMHRFATSRTSEIGIWHASK